MFTRRAKSIRTVGHPDDRVQNSKLRALSIIKLVAKIIAQADSTCDISLCYSRNQYTKFDFFTWLGVKVVHTTGY